MTAHQYAFNTSTELWVPVAASTSSGTVGLSVAELFAPQAEDNTNGIYAVTSKPLATNTYAPTLYTNYGAAAAAFIKASAGNVLAVRGTNMNAAFRFLQLHNKASIPLAGEVPLYSFKMSAGSATTVFVVQLGSEFFTGSGGYFSTGIGYAFSTTEGTYTAATATDHQIHVHYK